MMPLTTPLAHSSQPDDEPEFADFASAAAAKGEPAGEAPAILLRGTRSGLEIVIDGSAPVDLLAIELAARLEEAPGFFAGNDACVRVIGRLPLGALARLEAVTARFDLRIVEVGPARRAVGTADPGPGGAGRPREAEAPAAAPEPAPVQPEWSRPPELAHAPRLVIGPIRSGVVLDAPADLVVVGDVNPGAEIQARGNIIVLGRLRGVAHAAVGGECGFIFALRFAPQQLRIGRLVARAGESDAPGQGAEIAYATGRTIVVERYQGRLPSGLGAAA